MDKLPPTTELLKDWSILHELRGHACTSPHVVTPFVPNLVSLLGESDGYQLWSLVNGILDDYVSGSAERAAGVEAAQARFAFSIVEKHFARAGVEMEYKNSPTSWHSFCDMLYLNIYDFLRQGRQTKLLVGLLPELVNFVEAFSGTNFTENLFVLLVKFGPHYGWLGPLLPYSARARISEMEEMLAQQRDDDERLRLDAMYY